jgi:hypothetical protein
VKLTGVSANGNDEDGIEFLGESTLASIEVTGGSSTNSGFFGYAFDGDGIVGLLIDGAQAAGNGSDGTLVHSEGSASTLTFLHDGSQNGSSNGLRLAARERHTSEVSRRIRPSTQSLLAHAYGARCGVFCPLRRQRRTRIRRLLTGWDTDRHAVSHQRAIGNDRQVSK